MSKPREDYGNAALHSMRRMSEIGVDEWLAEEMEKPTTHDPQWCRLIVDMIASRASKPKRPKVLDLTGFKRPGAGT